MVLKRMYKQVIDSKSSNPNGPDTNSETSIREGLMCRQKKKLRSRVGEARTTETIKPFEFGHRPGTPVRAARAGSSPRRTVAGEQILRCQRQS